MKIKITNIIDNTSTLKEVEEYLIIAQNEWMEMKKERNKYENEYLLDFVNVVRNRDTNQAEN